MSDIHTILLTLLAYLLGSFPTGVVLSRRKYGIDVREMGSGNIGATNITRVFGWYAGVLVFVVDFFKGYVPIYLIAKNYPDDPWLATSAGIALVLGHCFSVYLRFSGGKGVATSVGVILAVAPWAAILSALVYVILLVTVRISAVGSLGGMIVALGYLGIVQPPLPIVVLVLSISFVVLVRHHSNIRRLVDGLKKTKQGASR